MASAIERYSLPHVSVIPPYPPGRPIEAVAREFGLDPTRIVKLASNENPLGCSPAAIAAVRDAAQDVRLYPDFDCHDLRQAIAARAAVSEANVLPCAGSSELIAIAARAFLDSSRSAVLPQYSFQSYEAVVRAAASTARVIPCRNWHPDLDALLSAVDSSTRILFLATPNNPTGTGVGTADLLSFAERLPPHVLLVVDEAYCEFLEPSQRPDVRALLARREMLLVLRTFSKIHGLAGLRVGYGVGHPPLLQLLRRLQLPFTVSSLAQRAAIAALSDPVFELQTRELNARERVRLAGLLDARGVEYVASLGNFILMKGEDGPAQSRELMKRGVIVRPVANYGLPAWLRVSIGRPEENDIFLAAFDEVRRLPASR